MASPMLETHIPSPDLAGPSKSAELRAFDWAELAARLAAARDLRGVFTHRRAAVQASFDRATARRFAVEGNGIPDVNPIGLGHGKPNRGIRSEVANSATNGDRE